MGKKKMMPIVLGIIVIFVALIIFFMLGNHGPKGYYYEQNGVYEYGLRFDDNVVYNYHGDMTGTYRYEDGLIYIYDIDDGAMTAASYNVQADTIIVEGTVLVHD